MLMHGEEVSSIEVGLQLDFGDLVDEMGRLAWISILNQFASVLTNKEPVFLQTNRYVSSSMSAGAHIEVAFKPHFENPEPAHFPNVEVSIETTRRPRKPEAKTENS